MITQLILIVWGFFLILGGFMGLKKGSKVSLIAGLASGILVLLGVWFLSVNQYAAWIYLSVLNALLTVSFTSRLLKTRKFMPSGMLLLMTLAVLVFSLSHLSVHAQ